LDESFFPEQTVGFNRSKYVTKSNFFDFHVTLL